MIRRVLLYINTAKDPDFAVSRKVAALCHASGVSVVLPWELAGALGRAPDVPWQEEAEDAVAWMPLREACMSCDLIITLGGDGTILRCAKLAAEAGTPILGLHLGTLGFMAELEVDELSRLPDILAGSFTLDGRMMLSIHVFEGEEVIFSDLALNDVLITGGATGRFISLSVAADDLPIVSFSGDGVIVATPTGSTAYSMAAGGPIIEPNAESISITPICAHALYAKSFVLTPSRVVTIRSFPERLVYLNVDGKGEFPIRPEHRITIGRAEKKTLLARVKENNYFETLGQKFQAKER